MPTLTAALLGPLLARDPHRPRITGYTTDGRAELSTASLANWSAKVAGLLRDELGAAPGDVAFVGTPPGWQTAAVLLGCWWAGLAVTDRDDPAAVAAFVPDPGGPGGVAVPAGADEVFVVSGHPLGAPSRVVAAHERDWTGAVLPQADRFTPPAVADTAPACAGSVRLSVADALALAREAAGRLGATPRVLSVSTWSPLPLAVALLGGALAADGSVVQLDDPDRAAAVAASEHATCTAGDPPATVPGLPAVPLR
ncbi:TIGR03089 family protein [Nakamurella endophytica]|uniref:TIGR03089 family protein n=1 Tax=Nakamurella endophytica TaxID=1748367 RepID=A0A917WFV2_9ACTN|nr:TIGR03089 family protein [Nakamurella endophytica]GGM01607.1 TIGR03089 family protein [Nakamurella endophytica]